MNDYLYRCIVADPPWKYGLWGSGSQKSRFSERTFNTPKDQGYMAMGLENIRRLGVERIADVDCDLYLWTTQRYLPDSFGVLESWGFRYCQTLTWCKAPMGTGSGGLFCPTTEFLLLGRKGKMPPGKKRIDTTWWNFPRAWKKHSRKPEWMYAVIEAVSDAPRVELFARRTRPGWDSWGNEIKSGGLPLFGKIVSLPLTIQNVSV